MCGVTRRNRIRNNYIKGTVKIVEVLKKIVVVWSCPAERGGSCMRKGHGHGGGLEEDKGKANIYRLKDSVSNGMQEMSVMCSIEEDGKGLQETVTPYKDGKKL